METFLEQNVTEDELQPLEKIYFEQLSRGKPSSKAQFDYAQALVRTKHKEHTREGISLLEDLFHKTADEHGKRDYLFFLAIGYTRLGEYDPALRYIKGILKVEPSNHQAKGLQEYIEKKMKRDGMIGMAIIGGAAAVAAGGLAALGIALAKR